MGPSRRNDFLVPRDALLDEGNRDSRSSIGDSIAGSLFTIAVSCTELAAQSAG